jgi:hypothetical protein
MTHAGLEMVPLFVWLDIDAQILRSDSLSHCANVISLAFSLDNRSERMRPSSERGRRKRRVLAHGANDGSGQPSPERG